jgi:hypothetical protein
MIESLTVITSFSTSKVRIKFHLQQCFFNDKMENLHVLANDGHYRQVTDTVKEMLHMYYMHACVVL